MSKKFRVLVLDGVSSRGVEVLKQHDVIEVVVEKSMDEATLVERLPGFHGLVVRSATKVGARAVEAAKATLRVIGRAGVGVDNVDVEAATAHGVIVMNTPGGNTISTAEHAFTLMLALARNIPQAHQSIREGKWDRKSFTGTEMYGKTLGVIGMGRIGSEFARRAIAFGMRVLAYDPYLAPSRARSLQVELIDKLEDILPQCDVLTLHMPMTSETRGLLNARTLKLCKKGVRIINCARGGLVEEAALVEALASGQVAGAALDVFEKEPLPEDFPLRHSDRVVLTPHLGASTAEAQESVGIEIAECMADFLINGTIKNAVNAPNVDARTLEALRPYLKLVRSLGLFLAQITSTRCEELVVNYSGRVGEHDTRALTRSALRGFLEAAGGEGVNEINAVKFAENLGLKVLETKQSEQGDFNELISLRARGSDGGSYEVSGTFFGNSPRVVRVNGFNLEARPEGVLFLMENLDRPGVVGWIGTLLAKHQINIASMSLSRAEPGRRALSLLNLDSKPSTDVIEEILQDKDIFSVRLAVL